MLSRPTPLRSQSNAIERQVNAEVRPTPFLRARCATSGVQKVQEGCSTRGLVAGRNARRPKGNVLGAERVSVADTAGTILLMVAMGLQVCAV